MMIKDGQAKVIQKLIDACSYFSIQYSLHPSWIMIRFPGYLSLLTRGLLADFDISFPRPDVLWFVNDSTLLILF
jgi:hypothetical protein